LGTFFRKHETIGDPSDIFGAISEPSCTETCNQFAPPSIAFVTEVFKSHKSDFAIEGETITSLDLFEVFATTFSNRGLVEKETGDNRVYVKGIYLYYHVFSLTLFL